MADRTIGALPAAPGVYDDTLFAAEQQGKAVRVTGRQLRSLSGGSSGSSGGSGGNLTYSGGGFVEMTQDIPAAERSDKTLYGLILKEYGG